MLVFLFVMCKCRKVVRILAIGKSRYRTKSSGTVCQKCLLSSAFIEVRWCFYIEKNSEDCKGLLIFRSPFIKIKVKKWDVLPWKFSWLYNFQWNSATSSNIKSNNIDYMFLIIYYLKLPEEWLKNIVVGITLGWLN